MNTQKIFRLLCLGCAIAFLGCKAVDNIGVEKAKEIAAADARKMYGDLERYDVVATFEDDNWRIVYRLKIKEGQIIAGGRSEYLVDGGTGKILNKKIYQ